MKIKIPQDLRDYALFCACDPSSDAYYDICRLLLDDDITLPAEWQDTSVVYDDELNVILVCDADDAEYAIAHEHHGKKWLRTVDFLNTYRSQLIRKHA